MSRRKTFSALAVLMVLAGCGGGAKSPPRDLDNACSIVSQRPNYLRAMNATEKKWGVPVPVIMAMIHQESKFDGDARTPFRWGLGVIPLGRQSSALGYSQALDGTWDEYKAATGARGKRTDIRAATDFMGWYMTQTRDRLGIPLSDAREQYLAYHEGWTGYKRGNYRRKAWLPPVATSIASRADLYDTQLRGCGKR